MLHEPGKAGLHHFVRLTVAAVFEAFLRPFDNCVDDLLTQREVGIGFLNQFIIAFRHRLGDKLSIGEAEAPL